MNQFYIKNKDNISSFIDNSNVKLYKKIVENLNDCDEFLFNVAFIHFSGVQMIMDSLKQLEFKIKGKILTSNYMNSTQPKALDQLKKFSNIDIKVYDSSQNGFHPKTYIFKKNNGDIKIIIGSSNLTESGIWKNIEWNIELPFSKDDILFQKIELEFINLWNQSKNDYIDLFFLIDDYYRNKNSVINTKEFSENKMQIQALKNLEEIRLQNQNKALIIAATGTGKTYLAALDSKKFNAKKILFIVHRHEIIYDAIKTFKKVFPNRKIYINKSDVDQFKNHDIIFCTVQFLYSKNNFLKIDSDYFDYIIIDESHHCASDSYQNIFSHFKYEFLLGMTATPERFDGKDIYAKFDYNVGYELRLKSALDENMLCSFHYFGINDQSVNWKDVDVLNYKNYENLLCIEERVNFILEKLNFYSFSGNIRKCLAFCASKKHAKYMNEAFLNRNLKSAYLISEHNKIEREEILNKFRNNEIEYLFCVDILNEGIDVPEINTILMLRPTQSPTIFIQQIGRGLRKNPNKDFLTIIDLIGNHNNIANLALSFNKFDIYNKYILKNIVENDFDSFSKNAFIKIDEISKQNILDKIESINFNSNVNVKKQYNDLKKYLNKIPNWMDFLNLTNHNLILNIIKNSINKSYLSFLIDETKEEEIIKYNFSESDMKIIRFIEKFISLKRVDEFEIIKHISNAYLLNKKDKFYLNDFNNLNINKKNIDYICNFLLQRKHFSKDSIENFLSLIKYNDYDNSFEIEKNFKDVLEKIKKNDWFKNYFFQMLAYGIEQFKESTNNLIKKENFFIGNFYSKDDILLLVNFNKVFSSFREGILYYNNQYYLLITLDKKGINENHQYKDELINEKTIIWQTQNKQHDGLKIFEDIKKTENNPNISNINVFIRKLKNDNKKENSDKFIYIGKSYYQSHIGNKPISFTLNLLNPINADIMEIIKI